jgi:hypothetical protein
MLRNVIKLGCVAGLAFGLQPAYGFSLLGPLANGGDAWQVPEIGYGLPSDIGAPKNLGEEYRWNTPTIYYAFDANFLDYFGSNGVWAVQQAIAQLNVLKPFSQYSANLTEVPLNTARLNYRAQALHLYDLKSVALYLTMEELGLAQPDRYIWTLRTRTCSSCPVCSYSVIMRNFDPVTWQPTAYLNDNLYSYFIQEICSGPPPLAVTVNFPVDPMVPLNFAVMQWSSSLQHGIYSTTLTRDDVGGLRYIYETNNINWESMSPDSTLFYTNIAGGLQLLFTSNLTTLASQALTNPPAALLALYPNLSIAATTNIYTNIWVTNLTAYFTNYPFDPYGTPPHLAFATNRTLTVQTWYHNIYNNVVTFVRTNNFWTVVPLPDIVNHTGLAWITVQTTTVTNSPFDPFGTPPHTNITSVVYPTNVVTGEYFIVPTNLCGIALASLQATTVTIDTNVVVSATNAPAGFTNTQAFTRTVLDYFTNHVFTYYPVDCVGTNVMLREGIDKFTFLQANFDSLLGRFFQPITNIYYLVDVTNSHLVTNWFERVVTAPDFLYTAQDLANTVANRTTTAPPNFNDSNEGIGLAGPGNIEPGKLITFNKVGPILNNFYLTNFLLDSGLTEMEATTNFIWGSYDGSTNDPVVYPSGTSIASLEAQILFQIITGSLPDGKVGSAYTPTQLQAAGGVPPYTSWTWGNGWPYLPPGLNLSPSGLITGTPTARGTYGFAVSVTGGDGRTITRSLSISINP